MALKTKIVVQQTVSIDPDNIIVGKYPRYVINMGTSISSITATELATAVDRAETAATRAKTSETNAKTSETNAKASETAASGSASTATTKASEAAFSATNAKTSETNAKTSETNAKTSETEAKSSQTAAKTSETNAAESARLADLAKQAAGTSETNAKASEIAAKASENAAKISETNAATSATEAEASNVDASDEADRAKAEADRAASIVNDKLDKEDIAKFFKGYKTKADADADVAARTVDEKVLVWNENGPKYSWYKVISTGGVLSLQLESDEAKMLSVNNIRPDSAGNVQVTIPGGNPSLWLGEVTWFPYDKDNTIGYSGILLADGRLLNRVDYPDVWQSISTGLIPSVTEAAWQAGSNMFYSTGNGTTTFRLPNLLQGQAFRAPTSGEADTSKLKAQVPYITTVNGVAPVDATGAVVIGFSNITGTLPLNQGGTGATTAAAARTNLGLGSSAVENTVPLTKGGTGATDAAGARTNLGLGSVAIENIVPIVKGGTGATTVAGIKTALNISGYTTGTEEAQIRTPDNTKYIFLNNDGRWGISGLNALSLSNGGTGATTAVGARTNLGLDRITQASDNSELLNAAGTYAIRLQDNGDWGARSTSPNTWKALGIPQGGTGGTDVGTANTGLGSLFNRNNSVSSSSPTLNDFTGPLGSGGETYSVNATNSHNIADWPTTAFSDTNKAYGWGCLYNIRGAQGSNTGVQTYIGDDNSGSMFIRIRYGNAAFRPWAALLSDRNTTVDSSGFIKRASPVVQIYGNGTAKTNAESEGAKVTRITTGEYLITGILGTNSDGSWGGKDGGFEIPIDRNKQPLIWLDYDVQSDGAILIKTYHRTYPDSPSFARNLIGYKKDGVFIETVKNGEPIDIPDGVFVSVRVGMPVGEPVENQYPGEETVPVEE